VNGGTVCTQSVRQRAAATPEAGLMDGCWLPDALLVPFERQLLAAVQQPYLHGGTALVWDLDGTPPATLRAVCWPRVAGTAGP
jgi:hypothetical protein